MTREIVVIAIKAVVGGTFVVGFALLGEMLRPKWFAGLFSAAPSVATASLIVTVIDKGHRAAELASIGMVFGAVGFVAFTIVVRPLLDHWRAAYASAFAIIVWGAIAIGGYFLILR